MKSASADYMVPVGPVDSVPGVSYNVTVTALCNFKMHAKFRPVNP